MEFYTWWESIFNTSRLLSTIIVFSICKQHLTISVCERSPSVLSTGRHWHLLPLRLRGKAGLRGARFSRPGNIVVQRRRKCALGAKQQVQHRDTRKPCWAFRSRRHSGRHRMLHVRGLSSTSCVLVRDAFFVLFLFILFCFFFFRLFFIFHFFLFSQSMMGFCFLLIFPFLFFYSFFIFFLKIFYLFSVRNAFFVIFFPFFLFLFFVFNFFSLFPVRDAFLCFIFLLLLVTAIGGRPKPEFRLSPRQPRRISFQRSATAIHSVPVDRTPYFLNETRTLYHWAITAHFFSFFFFFLFISFIFLYVF